MVQAGTPRYVERERAGAGVLNAGIRGRSAKISSASAYMAANSPQELFGVQYVVSNRTQQ